MKGLAGARSVSLLRLAQKKDEYPVILYYGVPRSCDVAQVPATGDRV